VLANALVRFSDELRGAIVRSMDARAGEAWYDEARAARDTRMRGEYTTDEEPAALRLRELPVYFARYDDAVRAFLDGVHGELPNGDALRHFNGEIAPTFDLRPELGRITAPTLVVTGENDPAEPVAAREVAAGIPGSRTVVVPPPVTSRGWRSRGRSALRCSISSAARLLPMAETGTLRVKTGLAEMLKGGVIMDVVSAEQAKIAEEAGAVAVMALERVPADIRAQGGVARMADPEKIREIQEAVTIPVMAKCRIGHFVEAQILEALEVDYIDESEVLTPADEEHHIDKWQFKVPFVCGCRDLGEALRRIAEGAAMIRTKGEAGTGDIVNAVRHMRAVFGGISRLQSLREEELFAEAKSLAAPSELVRWVAENGRLPVVTFTAGGIATPADAALCMQLGADGVFVGSGIFKSEDPERRAKAIVEATTHFRDPEVLARVSAGLGEPMRGVANLTLEPDELLQTRGW